MIKKHEEQILQGENSHSRNTQTRNMGQNVTVPKPHRNQILCVISVEKREI